MSKNDDFVNKNYYRRICNNNHEIKLRKNLAEKQFPLLY